MDILNVLAQQIRRAAEDRLRRMADVRVFLFDMQGLKVGES
jgi:hypothetical protein